MNNTNEFIPPHPLNTAVLFLVFNRLDTTKQVFESIRQAKPPRLYLAADGAREDKVGEAEVVQTVRDYVMQHIDWDCDIKTLFRNRNLGCKYAVAEAINWFFESEEQGIIIEDDCLPSQSFFWFCEDLLNRYKDDDRVCSISGNLRENNEVFSSDYIYKSYFFNMWGWATWRRQWKSYNLDFAEKHNSDFIIESDFLKYKGGLNYWLSIFKKMQDGFFDKTWDYQMMFQSFRDRQHSIYPRVNLVKNLGFGDDATHTFDKNSLVTKVNLFDIKLEKNHRPLDDILLIDEIFYNEYSIKPFFIRAIRKITRETKAIFRFQS